jgi:hypothetical protein
VEAARSDEPPRCDVPGCDYQVDRYVASHLWKQSLGLHRWRKHAVPGDARKPPRRTTRKTKQVQVPRPKIPPEIKSRFLYLVFDPSGPRMSRREAAELCGISIATGDRLYKAAVVNPTADARRYQLDLPKPRRWEQLGPEAQSALRDFNVFRHLYFADREQVWGQDASRRIVEALADSSERTFIDMNVFPGAGKTTTGLRIACWLICGGGMCDPAYGRALRLMFGHRTMKGSERMVSRIRGFLELRRPFYDKERRTYASRVLAKDFGRFKPGQLYGEETLWARDQFTVAQLQEVDLYEKEPTVQAASRQSGFLGERVNLAWWDDLVHSTNARTIEQADDLDTWFEDEAETRVEPGGVMCLVGQRLSARDLHRKRLDKVVAEPDGSSHPLYRHIVYPAHHDVLCDGEHRQWTGGYAVGDGCLTEVERLGLRDWTNVRSKANYRTVYQQEDADPADVLVQSEWLDGGVDREGFDAVGCYDTDRGWGQHPRDVGKLINYATVDPSPTRYWAVEWWAYQPDSRHNYLIWADRRKMEAGGERGLLDWNNSEQRFIGLMETAQRASVLAGQAIRCWVLEVNVAQRFLLQFEHYRRWRRFWPDVAVIRHETQGNKLDPDYGTSILSTRYKTGHKRLPNMAGTGLEGRNFMRTFVRELTTFPHGETDDTVLADWMGEFNLPRIVAAAARTPGVGISTNAKLPGYLDRRRHEIELIGTG